MSQKEVKRAQEFDSLREGKINQRQASKDMGVSIRQMRRLVRRHQMEGLDGLASKKGGKASNRRLDRAIRATAIELIGAHYRNFGPTLANKKLAELHGIQLCVAEYTLNDD